WAKADDVAEIRRVAERAAHVAAVGERDHAAGHSSRATARTAAAGLGEIVRIMGGTKNFVEGLRAQGKLRYVGFADRNRAGCFLALHEAAVKIRNKVFVERRAESGANACGLVKIFYADWQAVERPKPFTVGKRLIGGQRLAHQLIFRNECD